MADDSVLAFSFPAIHRRKVTAAFDGGRLTSDGGVLLLAQAERRLGIATRLASCIADPRDQGRVIHSLDGILRARILAIACGYEDADDLDTLRHDPGFKLALGKLPDGPVGLASQPTMSRWENAPTTGELVRLTGTLVDIYCASYPAPPAAVTLDIDDTCDVAHGMQQLSFWNGHHGERCFLPIHVYDTATARPVAMLLRTGKTPSGAEVAGHIRRLVRRIRRHWPDTHITLRGDGHYGRPEPMRWCEENGVDYVFGLPGNTALHADPVIALTRGSAEYIYDTLYCARGQTENPIKLHKSQLKSDRTSCRSANACGSAWKKGSDSNSVQVTVMPEPSSSP